MNTGQRVRISKDVRHLAGKTGTVRDVYSSMSTVLLDTHLDGPLAMVPNCKLRPITTADPVWDSVKQRLDAYKNGERPCP
jgi:hypothetical protein